MEFYASCPEGFDTALARELKALGLSQVRPLKGRMSFAGGLEDAYRTCLWSRLASRVFVVLARFDCADADDLYEGARAVAWENVIAPGADIAVNARGANDALRNSHYSALRVKDAICDRMVEAVGERPQVDVDDPDLRIALTLRGNRASLQLDLVGDPLYKRFSAEALRFGPANILRPDYAALLLMQAGWDSAINEGGPSLVSLCSNGGIELEAANMLCRRAPGLDRTHWGFNGWAQHDEQVWNQLVLDAQHQAVDASSSQATILSVTSSKAEAERVRQLMKKSGRAQFVRVISSDNDLLTELECSGVTADSEIKPIVVADMHDVSLTHAGPTLIRMTELRESTLCTNSELTVLTRDHMLERMFNAAPSSRVRLMPNNEEAELLTFPAQSSTDVQQANNRPTVIDLPDGTSCPVLLAESEQFARRLHKVAKLRRKWAKRKGITCYRVYDADLPDYSAAIDLYEGSAKTPGRWLVVAEYAAPSHIDADLAEARMFDMLTLAPQILGIDQDCVFAKARTRSRGGSQYATRPNGSKRADRQTPQSNSKAIYKHNARALIEEGGLTFEVNFDEYLDTGIFLDHRITRSLVRERAKHSRYFLNLFAYTGTATCYAADAGIEETVTVDLSNTYLDWTERNMELNGFTGPEHHFVRADVMQWIRDMRRTANRWDLIFCDPPTFSNSSKMGRRTWDVQRDHVELLAGLSHLLTHDGEAIFSCNLRTFRPDVAALERAGIELIDITAQTIPEDFARNKRIHHCYIVRKL